MSVGKRDRTRNQLLRAAQGLALEGGAGALTVNSICEQSELAVGTFYNYYLTREDVLFDICLLLVSACAKDVAEVTRGMTDPIDIISASINQTLNSTPPGSMVGRLMFETNLSMEPFVLGMRDFLKKDLEVGVQQSVFNIDDLSVTISVVSGICLGVMQDIYASRLGLEAIPKVIETILTHLGVAYNVAQERARRKIHLQPPRQIPLRAIELLPPLSAISK
jgi:AcrR family transcriptional regulator